MYRKLFKRSGGIFELAIVVLSGNTVARKQDAIFADIISYKINIMKTRVANRRARELKPSEWRAPDCLRLKTILSIPTSHLNDRAFTNSKLHERDSWTGLDQSTQTQIIFLNIMKIKRSMSRTRQQNTS